MDFKNFPAMLYADSRGRIYEHPYYRLAGFLGDMPVRPQEEDLFPVPEFSKLFFMPDCHPIGLDPESGEYVMVPEMNMDGLRDKCHAVAVFLEPGLVRSLLPAADYASKSYILPLWAYTAVGYRNEGYWAPAFRVEYNHRWDPRNYDDNDLVKAMRSFLREVRGGPLLYHLIGCATRNHCFAAKNLFLGRWEAPLPVAQGCNAACLGCLSLQSPESCEASHQRISFRPTKEEIVSLATRHLERAPEAIVSFGQGCEGEPLTEHVLIAESIRAIRAHTNRGTINLNTNGSWPERLRLIARSGLDSVRISLNSALAAFYRAYFRPKNYDFDDVVVSISVSRDTGIYTMVNYLVFPGINDQEEEIEAMMKLIRKTGLNMIHLKNLNIDPQLYLNQMPEKRSRAVGMKKMLDILRQEFPDLEIGYFNRALGGARAQQGDEQVEKPVPGLKC
jgi:pyruvate-formate lyase-activating enzyme